ncbi:protein kinase domain containing protein [Stylonychia lemnae]|uniref:non-specific serine/threonine protein kinase n=1 Tax=Stylonychia lemnae TaxID=5949 RepID=A0A078B7Q1_STYLE|nr:protein kinase domain containing protein [Stylonychia lemnae]|eukprot:CDW89583.1 protein kinase domain containing protein [Stylonychia lemnae]
MNTKFKKSKALGSGSLGTVYLVQRISNKLNYALKEFNQSKYTINEEIVIALVKQILKGLKYCHKNKIKHKALKPSNILINSKNIVKIGDIGFSKFSLNELPISQDYSRLYMAPEILEGQQYDSSADIWALGCIIYELIELQQPFVNSIGSINFQKDIVSAKQPNPKRCSMVTIMLIKAMIEPDKNKRITASKALQLLNEEELQLQTPSSMPSQSLNCSIVQNQSVLIYSKPSKQSIPQKLKQKSLSNLASVKFEGKVSCFFERDQGKIELRADKISNELDGPSGLVKMELWAIPQDPTKDNNWYKSANGYILARYQFNQSLDTNQYFHNVRKKVDQLKKGKYGKPHVLSLKLYTLSKEKWIRTDARVFDGQKVFKKGLEFIGNTGFQTKNNYKQVEFKIDKIQNSQNFTSGTIRIVLAACELNSSLQINDYEQLMFYELAEYSFGQLEQNQCIHNIKTKVDCNYLESGDYILIMKLQQNIKNAFVTEDQIVYETIHSF